MLPILDETRLALASLGSYAHDLVQPTLRLGVTGLSRAGKTVFITALVQGLLNGARWPVFEAQAKGRIARVRLAEQPNAHIPRFPFEDHARALTGEDRHWPEGTRRISEIRLVIDYASEKGLWRGRERSLTLDIVDYPGEWLLDLPLLAFTYAEWSAKSLLKSRLEPRASLSGAYHALLNQQDTAKPASADTIAALSRSFTEYLRACRDDRYALSTLPPGRFLMPGDMEGSPALTFAPLPPREDAPDGSLYRQMEKRYEAYKAHVIIPFFREHFALLDRQIVLVDALSALNAGPAAMSDLETAMSDLLTAFRHGANSLFSSVFARRIDKVLFAATKADHLHHTSHDRLEAILARLTGRAMARASFAGAEVDVLALAALRATRETTVSRKGETLPCIVGTPLAGEKIGDTAYDGLSEAVLFPGDLPADPDLAFREGGVAPDDVRFLRFRPPLVESGAHIRLDRAVQFLLGDRLQ